MPVSRVGVLVCAEAASLARAEAKAQIASQRSTIGRADQPEEEARHGRPGSFPAAPAEEPPTLPSVSSETSLPGYRGTSSRAKAELMRAVDVSGEPCEDCLAYR